MAKKKKDDATLVAEQVTQQDLFTIQRSVYKDSLYEFFLDAVKVHKPGVQFKSNWHIEYLCDVLQREAIRVWKGLPRDKHLLINVPPRSTKSVLVSIIFPVWVWTFYPECEFITCSYGQSLAEELSTYSRDLITSEWFQLYFGDAFQLKDDTNSKSNYKNSKGGGRLAKGRRGVTGRGGMINILDDAIDPELAESEPERNAANRFYSNVFSNRLNDMEVGLI